MTFLNLLIMKPLNLNFLQTNNAGTYFEFTECFKSEDGNLIDRFCRLKLDMYDMYF